MAADDSPTVTRAAPPVEEPSEHTGPARPDLIEAGRKHLGWVERTIIRTVRASFEPGPWDRVLRWLQRTMGQAWIHHATKNLRRVSGPIPELDGPGSVLVVANHRSFFDLYVITAELVRRGLTKRIVFPVRSNFFYDSFLGLLVNFWMSFLAMYPPIFRDRKKAALNLTSLDELGFLLNRGGVFAGLHPEGTRKKDDDPYTFLPAQPGLGRVIHRARVPVVPVFVNGLGNDLLAQVRGNWNGRGTPIHVVFGEPIDFSDLLDQRPSPRLFREISERCLREIGVLGEQERSLRASLPPS
ncbi:MAG TPA: lysophospholipid acyltransferase family protein [Polyangiaceae bacterium]|nr:lysophospholipid acyltransferase family protein [Polyangiaceae bacterium]